MDFTCRDFTGLWNPIQTGGGMMRTLAIGLLCATALIGNVQAADKATIVKELAAKGQTLAEDQTVNFWALDNLSAIDPGISEGTDASEVQRQIFEGLFTQDFNGNLRPALAIKTSVSEDKKTYTFDLRKEAKWSDGKPVTAHDFVYAWRRVVDPATASPYSYYFDMMKVKNAADITNGLQEVEKLGVKAIDDHTLEVTLSTPIPYFTKMLVSSTTYPVPQWAIEEHGDRWTREENLVVNGPYKMTANNLGEVYTVERNETYWNNENTILDKINFVIVPNINQALTRFLAGELDFVNMPTGQYPRLKKEYPDQAQVQPRLCTYYVTMNMRENAPEALKDVRVRRALWLAVDRDILIDNILQGGQIPAYSFTHIKTAGYTPPRLEEAKWSQAKRDEKARELLSAAGYGPDNPLAFDYVYNTSEGHKQIAIYLQQQWKNKLGAKIAINNVEWKTLLSIRDAGDFELSRNAWCGDYNEASTFVDLFHSQSTQNDSKYNNSQVDDLLELSKTKEDPQELYAEIEKIAADEGAMVPLYHYTRPFMLNPAVKGWPFGNVQQFWYATDLYKVAK